MTEWTAEQLEGIKTEGILNLLNEYQRMLNLYMSKPPYSHRNGETEKPEVNGHYWIDYEYRPDDEWLPGRTVIGVKDGYQFGLWDGWDGYNFRVLRYYGPIPEPKKGE